MAAAIRLNEQHSCSFDHLVGAGEQIWWHLDAECAGGRQIDDELELGRLYDRQVLRLRALKDATHIDADLTIRIPNVGSIAHQPAGFSIVTHVIDCWKGMSCRQYSKLEAPADKERTRAEQQRSGFVVNKRPEYRLNLATIARLNDIDLKPDGRRRRRHIPHRAFCEQRLRIDK